MAVQAMEIYMQLLLQEVGVALKHLTCVEGVLYKYIMSLCQVFPLWVSYCNSSPLSSSIPHIAHCIHWFIYCFDWLHI